MQSTRARALYERLGYVAYGSNSKSRAVGAEGGSAVRYQTMCTLMRKELQ
jgi:hypothetical protein